MCVDLRRLCMASNKLHVLSMVRLLNILTFVVLSLQMQIQAYLLRKLPKYAQCLFFT